MTRLEMTCPFCGGGNISDRHVRDGRQMFCIGCGASVAPTYHGPRGDTLERAKEAWNTRLAAAPLGDVRIKPLEWDKHPDDEEWYSTDRGNYQVCDYIVHRSPVSSAAWCLKVRGHLLDEDFASSNEAKSAAKADYEQRVRAAIDALVPGDGVGEATNALYWAVGRWNAEVYNRPLKNVHRRSLDTTWRQVIRHFGGDDEELCGPRHDQLVEANPAALDALVPAGGVGESERLRKALEAVRFNLVRFAGYAEKSIMIEGIDAALAPQNAGGESSDVMRAANSAADKVASWSPAKQEYASRVVSPSEATPAPAEREEYERSIGCGCGELCQDLGVGSGCRYISNPPADAIIGGTALCGHGVMAAICEICNIAAPAHADDEPLSDRDHAMIDQAWENYKAALPVATVINDNQPGRTAIIEITIDPPTLPIGTKLYAGPKMVELPPAPADDAAVATNLPVHLFPIKASRKHRFINDAHNCIIAELAERPDREQWAVYLARPAKAVDVEAVAHIIDPTAKFQDIDGVRWSRFDIERRELAREKARGIIAILRDIDGQTAPAHD